MFCRPRLEIKNSCYIAIGHSNHFTQTWRLLSQSTVCSASMMEVSTVSGLCETDDQQNHQCLIVLKEPRSKPPLIRIMCRLYQRLISNNLCATLINGSRFHSTFGKQPHDHLFHPQILCHQVFWPHLMNKSMHVPLLHRASCILSTLHRQCLLFQRTVNLYCKYGSMLGVFGSWLTSHLSWEKAEWTPLQIQLEDACDACASFVNARIQTDLMPPWSPVSTNK